MIGLWALALPAPVIAMDGDQDLLRRQQEDDARRMERRFDEWYVPRDRAVEESVPAARGDRPGQDGERCFPIRYLRLDGAGPVLDGHAIRATRDTVEGHCVGVEKIRALQADLTQRLIDRGYVTSRVLVPEQDLSAGELHLVIVPGRLERYAGDWPRRSVRAAFPLGEDDPLHLPSLEQGIENLNRLPGAGATIHRFPAGRQRQFPAG